jgi:hypothetical protein
MAGSKVLEVLCNGKHHTFHYYTRSYKSFQKTMQDIYGHWGKLTYVERSDLTAEQAEVIWRTAFQKHAEESQIAFDKAVAIYKASHPQGVKL